MQKNKVTVGAGKVYIAEYSESTGIPEDAALEVAANIKTHTSGGITFSYSSDSKEIEDDLGEIVDEALSKETLTCKFGLLSHDAEDVKQLCSTSSVDVSTSNTITTEIGGIENDNGKKYIVRFVHTNKAGKKTRHTMVGKSSGFSLPYQKGEATVIDCEFKGYHFLPSTTATKKRLLVIKQEVSTT